jgi:hypothetical protein
MMIIPGGREKVNQDRERADGGLLCSHLYKMKQSGLTDETIRLSGAYSMTDIGLLRILLGGIPVSRPGLLLPFFDASGNQSGHIAVRMMPPHKGQDGRLAKYLVPVGSSCHAYFPPFPCLWRALEDPEAPIVIVEGIFKALAACQDGVATIGLMGMWNWTVKSDDSQDGYRKMIPQLGDIHWRHRTIVISPDSDPSRKPTVNHGVAELAAHLARRGGRCLLPRLPLGRDNEGLPVKVGLDDYYVKGGPGSIRRWIDKTMAEAQAVDSHSDNLDNLRRRMTADKEASLTAAGFYYNGLPPGVGKTTASVATVIGEHERTVDNLPNYLRDPRSAASSAFMVPTHSQAEEIVAMFADKGKTCVPYPQLSTATCGRYDEAAAVLLAV